MRRFQALDKPERGARQLPVPALLYLPQRRLFGDSRGTHRMSGVMSAVNALSPVESSSPPWSFELQFPCTLVRPIWQGYFLQFLVGPKIAAWSVSDKRCVGLIGVWKLKT